MGGILLSLLVIAFNGSNQHELTMVGSAGYQQELTAT